MDLAALLPRYFTIRRGSFVIAAIGICINPWRILNVCTPTFRPKLMLKRNSLDRELIHLCHVCVRRIPGSSNRDHGGQYQSTLSSEAFTEL